MIQPRSILIGICTFRRSSIRETLESLAAQNLPEETVISVCVADNDTEPSARERIGAVAASLPFPVTYLHAPARNISIARNAILDHAHHRADTALAFIDDDETVDPGWLAALLARQQESGCAAVVGPVRAAYRPGAPDWMRRGAVHDTEPDIDANAFAHTGYTCNVLLALNDPRLAGLRFDLARGRSGGEDTAYFAHYQAAGGHVAFAPDAVARETVPDERARLDWLLRRRFRMGQTHGGLICDGVSVAGRATQTIVAGLKLIYFLMKAAAAPFDALQRNRAFMRGALHAGTISGCLSGRQLQLYGTASFLSGAGEKQGDEGTR